MDRKTFLGAIIRLIISHTAVSKSICGNLNRRLKKRGILMPWRRLLGTVPPKLLEGPPWRGSEICGFMTVGKSMGTRGETAAGFRRLGGR